MKKLILLSSIALLYNCNNSETKKSTETVTNKPEKQMSEEELLREAARVVDSAAAAGEYQADVEVYGENPKMVEAKKLLDEANSYVRKGILKEMTTSAVNEKINPIMSKFENINSQLSSAEKKELENYRITEINKVIDLQAQQDSK